MAVSVGAGLPTLYEYYTGGGIKAGLSDKQPYFTLNNKNITIYSGAFHYFRVPRAYWRDRLRKMKAAGLNTVETYTPWSLHEPEPGEFDFGKGGSDMEDFLHLEEFLKTAKEEDLFAIVRGGPYSDTELDFGGLPSWLMGKVKSVRNSKDTNFLTYVKRFFNVLLPILAALQFQKGGPIIMFQVENEYGSTGLQDHVYLNALKQMHLDHGIKELLCTSDPPRNERKGAIDGVLQTANFAGDPKQMLDWLNKLQTGKPSMAMESYTGWFDHWTDNHHHKNTYKKQLEGILDYPASVNMYMFIGSTNFGFINGATISSKNSSGLRPDTTSYDYDSPITEYGAYASKYNDVKEVIANHNKIKTKLVTPPAVHLPVSYPSVKPSGQIQLSNIIDSSKEKIASVDVVSMEKLNVNKGAGQSYGYIVYRKTGVNIPANAVLKISGYVQDTVLVLINGKLISPAAKAIKDLDGFGFWKLQDSTITLSKTALKNATIDLVVENAGRNTRAVFFFKGLTNPVYINNEKITNWQIIPLEFRKSWNNALSGWKTVGSRTENSALYKFTVNIASPEDTFLDMRKWSKGIAIVNGFVLGKYFSLGPQQTLYLPAPLLKKGQNEIVICEHYNAPETLDFAKLPIFQTAK